MLTGLLIKPEPRADSLLNFCVRARLQSSLAPPSLSIPANRCASLWHTDIIAARQNKPSSVPLQRHHQRRGRGPAARRRRRRRSFVCASFRAPCHPDCKHELQNGAAVVRDRLPHASPTRRTQMCSREGRRTHRDHRAQSGMSGNQGMARTRLHSGGTMTPNGDLR